MQPHRAIRRFACVAACTLALLALPKFAPTQQKSAPSKTSVSAAVKPKIRTVTAFINLEPAQYQQQIAETMQMLRRAKTIFESRGFEVESLRIATQPFPEYTKGMTTQQAVAFFQKYD